MEKTNYHPTMADVAKEAGVALGTVSKVVNNQRVGETYRQKVEDAIERLGYRYNNSGRALRTNQTGTIALILPNTVHPYFALLVHHINAALSRRNYRMLLFLTQGDHSQELECIRLASQNRVDGIIALTYTPHLEIPEGIRFVTIDRFFSHSIPCVASDNFSGGQLAVHKLHEFGCRKLLLLHSTSALRNEPNKRKDGFVSACEELKLSYQTLQLVEENITQTEVFEEFLASHVHNGQFDFDGIFCCSDLVAWSAKCTMQRMNIRVPEDVQIIGFDGIRMFGTHDYITSTIVQPVPEIAEVCVSTVLSEDFSSISSLICLPVKFAYGGTTKKQP